MLALISHPVIVFFHLFFRVSAIVTYIFCGLFSDNFVMDFIVIVLLLSCDFWTVKNISGRLLVGLRWWNYIREDGTSEWIFESRATDESYAGPKPNPAESRVFWISLYVCPFVWVFFCFWALLGLHFSWVTVCVVGIVLNSANLIGYQKCRKDMAAQRAQVEGMATNFLASAFINQARTRFSSFTGGSGNN